MPSNDDLIPAFDDFDEQLPTPADTADQAPARVAKKVKKKSKKYVKAKLSEEEEEAMASNPLTPSPPTQYDGVLLPDHAVEAVQDAPDTSHFTTGALEKDFTHAASDLPQATVSPPPPLPKPAVPRAHAASSPQATSPPTNLFTKTELEADTLTRQQNNGIPPQFTYKSRIQRQPLPDKPAPLPGIPDAPPPHMSQPHFYGAPDLGLGMAFKASGKGAVAGSDGFCCRLDSMADAGDLYSAKKAKDVLLVGWNGGLEVYRIVAEKLEVIGRLEGLRGGVMDAKILPHIDRVDSKQNLRPLVAVILHGPMNSGKRDSGLGQGEMRDTDAGFASQYQTTVELYSLQTQQYVTTLYKSLPVEVSKPVLGMVVAPPAPVGDLALDANGRFVIVASGKSGEIFVFSDAGTSNAECDYRCIGKLWTSVQIHQPASRTRNARGSDTGSLVAEKLPAKRQPLFSIGPRWLTLVPPASSFGISIQGSPLLSSAPGTAPGLVNHSAPSQPVITCETAGVDAEGALSRWTRQAAQGFWKASQIGFENAKYGWMEFTNPSPPTGAVQHSRGRSRDQELFPPTNAPSEDPNGNNRYPTLVSVIDLERLLEAEQIAAKHVPSPLITFMIPDGCNHVSLSPNGLRLMTSDRSGEKFRIWDFSNAVYNRQQRNDVEQIDGNKEPFVQQISVISRNSPSIALDSSWSRDGDWIAIVSDHGTVHLHEVPREPPKKRSRRRSTVRAPPSEKAEPIVGVSQGFSPPSSSGFLGSFRTSWQTVTTQVNTIRNQATPSALGIPRTFNEFRETAMAARNASGRAMARGLSQGYIAAKGGASDLWHADDNKIRPGQLAEFARYGCTRWIHRKSGASLAVACAGTVHMNPVQMMTRRKGDEEVRGLKADKHTHKGFVLPPISKDIETGVSKDGMRNECGRQGSHGFWSLQQPQSQRLSNSGSVNRPTTTSYANDVETNPPYCPFHVDPRVNIFVYDDDGSAQFGEGHGGRSKSLWLFGDPLPSSTKVNETLHNSESDNFDEGVRDDEMSIVAQDVESKLTVRSSGGGLAGDRIRIHTRPTDRRPDEAARMGDDESAPDEGFHVLEEV